MTRHCTVGVCSSPVHCAEIGRCFSNPPNPISQEGKYRQALQRIADMDPAGQRADDLGRAARIAREALAGGVLVPRGGEQ